VLLALGALVGVTIGLAIAFSGATRYGVTSTVLLSEPGVVESGSSGLDSQQKLNLLAFTYVEVLTSDSFVLDAIDDADVEFADLSVEATAIKNTSAVDMEVTAAEPEQASGATLAILRAVQDPAVDVFGASAAALDVLVVDVSDAKRVSTDRVFVVVASLVGGLVIAGMFALLLETQ
jgi:uncharacterized protein involved in exopolysaccharide biosynthesis